MWLAGVPPASLPDLQERSVSLEVGTEGRAYRDRVVGLRKAPHLRQLSQPRPLSQGSGFLYTHAFDRDALETSAPDLERLDLQLIAMIDEARSELADRGIDVESKVLLNGFSASGSFVNRFALLHPHRVRAVAMGSPGGWPTVPAYEWQGTPLRFPVGIADVEAFTLSPFQLSLFRSVPAFVYIGDADDNDAVPFTDGYDEPERDVIYALFGAPPALPWVRWDDAEAIYHSVGSIAEFYVYPGVDHEITPEMLDDLEAFFALYVREPSPELSFAACLATLLLLRWRARRMSR